VTRFQAQLAAVAYVNAAVKLDVYEFSQRVHRRVPAGPRYRLLEIFFEEVAVEAGLWARATFAAEVLGEATLTGSLLPNASGGPGFTYSLQYGAGFGYGTGFEFRTNFGIEDPRRLLDRLTSATTTELILAEVNRYVGQLPPDQAGAARKAVAVLRTLLPLAMRSTFQLGINLASTDAAHQRTVAASMVESVVREAQEQLLRAAVDIAVGQLGRLLGVPTTATALLTLGEDGRNRAIDDLLALRKQLELLALVACLPPLEDLLAIGALPPAVTDECRRALALFWSAATLVNRVLSWVDDPAHSAGELFGVTPVAMPANSTIAAYVASRIGKPSGSALTFSDLVRFVLGVRSGGPAANRFSRSRRRLELARCGPGLAGRRPRSSAARRAGRPGARRGAAASKDDVRSLQSGHRRGSSPAATRSYESRRSRQRAARALYRRGRDTDARRIAARRAATDRRARHRGDGGTLSGGTVRSGAAVDAALRFEQRRRAA
jgi:hypothetical protein